MVDDSITTGSADDDDTVVADDTTYQSLRTPKTSQVSSQRHSFVSKHATAGPSPLEHASSLSILTTYWLEPLIRLGATKHLEQEDLWEMCASNKCAALSSRFQPNWLAASSTPHSLLPPFAMALLKTCRRDLWKSALSFCVYTVLTATQPFFVQSLLQFLEDKPTSLGIEQGYVLVLCLSLISFVAVTTLNYGFFIGSKAGVNMRSIAMNAVYDKALRLSSGARQSASTGEIVTLMSADSERIFEAAVLAQWAWISPLTLLVSYSLVAYIMGPLPALGGALVMTLIVLVSFNIAKNVGRTRGELMLITEERVKITSEVLQGIRVMKYYAWEASMLQRVEEVRAQEIQKLAVFHYYRVFNLSFLFLSPVFASAVVLVIFLAQGHALDVGTVFTMLTFINISRLAVAILPVSVSALSEAHIAVGRMNAYLDYDELEGESERDVQCQHHPFPIQVSNGSFSWTSAGGGDSSTGSTLKQIDLKVPAGALVMIVGSVGSGKSSLMSALLGEMHKHVNGGSCRLSGQVAYANQEPWIRNETVQKNIVFGAPLDKGWYDTVVKASQLTPDLRILAQGDRTEIGERGINLSGGQKARISLARAIYHRNADILLMDDPLSAVDVHVAQALFDECIAGLAGQKTRLLVLNSHYHLLPKADRVIVMSEGRIVGDGSYSDMASHFPHLCVSEHRNSITKAEDHVVIEHASAAAAAATTAASTISCEEDEDEDALMDEEDRERGAVSRKIYTAYFDNVGLNGAFIFAVIILTFAIGQVFRISVDWWQGEWADAEEQDDPQHATSYYSTIFISLILATTVLAFARSYLFINVTIRCSKNLHQEILRRVLRAPITRFFDVTPVGRILNRFSRDLDQVDSILPDFFLQFIQNMFIVVSVFAVCAVASWWIVLTYIPMVALFILTKQYFERTSRELKRLEGITRTPIFSSFAETLNGLHTIRAYDMQKQFADWNRGEIDNNSRFFFGFWSASRWLALRLDWLSALLITIVSMALIWTKGSLDPAVAGLALVYSLMLTSILQWTVRVANMTENTMTAVERMFHYRTIATEAADLCPETDPPSSWPTVGAIEFVNVQLRYRPELDAVLKGVTLSIKGGEKIGICGRTGAGKSSLMVALFRIAELEPGGSITIDGVDIGQIGLKTLRSQLSIIPQDPVLFSGTLRENLDPFNQHADAEIWAILKQVHLGDVVKTNAHMGLSFVIAEKGENLSVGQRQLLCIGRALLRKSKIIVMDEATANVDLVTDTLIQATIRKSFAYQTVLTIAHRLDTILSCDRIVVLDAGIVAEFDAPSVLMKKTDGMFRSLAEGAGIEL